MRFYYHDGDGNIESIVWSRSGEQGDGWKDARVEMYEGKYVIKFQAIIGSGFASDIALDDIEITDKPCWPVGRCIMLFQEGLHMILYVCKFFIRVT